MAVAGVPEPQPDHGRRAIALASAMLDELGEHETPSGSRVMARVGICSGPLVAGMIGDQKFIYDLWGDTVNTASRMESHGLPNRVQVTTSTYEILRGDFEFEDRGVVDIKGKGPTQT